MSLKYRELEIKPTLIPTELGIIAKAVKTRKASAAEYRKATDFATTEEVKRSAEANYNTELSEAGLLERYLPQRAFED